ncbi:unnamed protein product [Parnassius apollo]|uniref:(apollo) hypothetical protein n=1 Tax=Parnassius apollo TaxID=110799 RepID=A0A8S3WIC3_PARAO|nr:unnamed protein product [Parnassius apollo]
MFKTPPQNNSVASKLDPNTDTKKSETSAGKDKGTTSHVRKSVGELESRLGAAPKTKTADLPTKHKSKISPAVECDVNQEEIETTKYLNKAQEAKAHVVKIKLLLNSSRNLKTEIKDKIAEAAEKLYRLTKGAEEVKENTIENDTTKLVRKQDIEFELLKKMEEHSKLLTECRIETQRISEEVKSHRDELITYSSVVAKRNRGQPLDPNAAHFRDTVSAQMHSVIVSPPVWKRLTEAGRVHV